MRLRGGNPFTLKVSDWAWKLDLGRQINRRKAGTFIKRKFYETWEPSEGNDNPKKWLSLSKEMVKPLGLMKSGESWKPMIRQRVCNKGGKLGEEQGLPVWSPLGVPQSSQIRCSFLTHTGRASLPWECSDPRQGRWGRSESPSSSCCFCDLLPGRGFMTTEFFGEALLLGSWWFQELKCL